VAWQTAEDIKARDRALQLLRDAIAVPKAKKDGKEKAERLLHDLQTGSDAQRADRQAKFMAQLPRFRAQRDHFWKDHDWTFYEEKKPALRGKLVVLMQISWEAADPFFYYEPGNYPRFLGKLLGDLWATAPEAVDTLVLLKWEKKQIGFYKGRNGTPLLGGAAHQYDCEVKVIDYRKKTRIARGSFIGRDPEVIGGAEKTTSGSTAAWDQVLAYLKKLREASASGPAKTAG
jgi:hypothetical protein